MLIPSHMGVLPNQGTSLSRRVNANSQLLMIRPEVWAKLIKKGEC